MTIACYMPVIVKSEMNLREHWRTRKKRFDAQRATVRLMLARQLVLYAAVLGAPFQVHLVRIGRRRLDSDNLAGGFKAVRDEVALLLGVDDGDEKRVGWIYQQEPTALKRGEGIRIEIRCGHDIRAVQA